MLKTLLIIPSSTSQKFTHYCYFILISLPIIPILFNVYIIATSKIVNESHLCLSLN